MSRVAILILCLATLLVGQASSAQADTATRLPFVDGKSSPTLVVDPSGGHVFVSGGAGNSSIVVLDYKGRIVKTIAGEGGASGMALDSATHTLYVALHDATAISEINTQTLTEVKRFSTAPYPDPSSLVIAGGKLWFSCLSGTTGCLASANLDGTGLAAPIFAPALPLFLASGGTNGHLLAFGYTDATPPNVYVYDVSGSTPKMVSYAQNPNGGSGSVRDMTFDRTGANLLLASGAPGYIQALTTTTLLSSGTYPTGPYPISVALSADGKYVAGGIDTNQGPDVFVYRTGSSKPVRTWQVGDDSLTGLPHNLAFSPDTSRLFAIAIDSATGHLAFHVLLRPTVHLAATSLKLGHSTSSVRYGSGLKFKIRAKGARKGKVDLFALSPNGAQKRVASGRLRSGAVTLTARPKRSTMYSAQLEQGLRYASATSKSVTIAVVPALSVSTRPAGSVSVNGQRVSRTRLIAHLAPTAVTPSEILEFDVQRRENGSWVLTATNRFPIGYTSPIYFFTTQPGLCRVQAVYGGDGIWGRTKSAWKVFEAH